VDLGPVILRETILKGLNHWNITPCLQPGRRGHRARKVNLKARPESIPSPNAMALSSAA
jgi:hypothetical protein